ncbi:hypothetical protein LWC34_10100 [Kibdelosporangium philippinense]|uniref:Adenylate cyclase, class 3 n=1 Tax=Kibdelosporangium philippinense TaxID=211113 RepID=A0ABS8Z5M3_9PSEU|nr:hypothetical protein [Kibdelosporangium philippinense]MCE7003179.1 hypothetical protein [Kibdelosporangium philippinense]
MNSLPQHHALLGVDVIGSARNPGHYLEKLQSSTDTMLRTALTDAGVQLSRATNWEPTGDGALVTLPSSDLGALFDAASLLEVKAAEHNRWHKPDVRLRIAVHVGPVGPEPGYYEPKITLSRLLNAPVFKQVVERCLAERRGDVNTGLIVSDNAYRAVFGGDHTRLVTQAEFASVAASDKEFAQPAWIRVPGFEAKSLVASVAAEGPASASGAAPAGTPNGSMQNTANGPMSGLQANTIAGNVSFRMGQ